MKYLLTMLLAVTMTAMVSLAAKAQEKGEVYYLIPDSGGPFYPESAKVMSYFLEQVGYKLTTLDATQKSDIQLNQIDNVINLKPKAMVVAAVDFDAVVPGIERARAAGISVMAFDRQISSTKLDLTSVAGTVEIGHNAAEQAIRLLKERKGQAKGKVLQITGDPGDSYSVSVRGAFDEVIAKYPDIKVETKAAMQWEPTNAANITQDYLQTNPDVDMIFYHSGYLASAVVAILQSAGKKPGDILMLDADGDIGGLAQIRAGWQQIAVGAPMYAQAYAIAMFLDKILKGEPLKAGEYEVLGLKSELTDEKWGPNLKIPGALVTKDNVDDPIHWANGKLPTQKVVPVQ
ncbi:sugar ABC transporter substrate-binding protein [Rhizobium leguminosarum]|uniref:sugar ABC transporter substrate-binding protein n=1 Tax=Rhizobium leguminosarum TaxID=384 RepID=UPI001C973FBF|nr:sugar ABC transporter substrate-binding protein [Rhizobium leguminosarum]MBY5406685.1 sugar ABC transporter substrate-binding protein [Rhizobium leguminosarum]